MLLCITWATIGAPSYSEPDTAFIDKISSHMDITIQWMHCTFRTWVLNLFLSNLIIRVHTRTINNSLKSLLVTERWKVRKI